MPTLANVSANAPNAAARTGPHFIDERTWLRVSAIVVRTPGTIDVPVSLLREHVARLNPNLPVFRVMTFEEVREMSAWNVRLTNVLMRSIAGVALLLAVVGLYAVTGHTVERWRRELGCVPLGAGAGEIRWLVIRHVFAQLGTGLGVGVVGTQFF